MRFIGIRRQIAVFVTVISLTNLSVFAQQNIATGAKEQRPGAVPVAATSSQRPSADVEPLKGLIEEALARNPEIQAMARNFDMMRARVPQAKALPDPMLEVGTLGNIVPIPPFDIQKGDPSSARMLSVSQEIPFPGKLALKGKMANADAEAEWWNYEQTRLNVIAELKDTYFDYTYLAKALEVVNKNKDLLEKFVKIAEARYAVGRGIQQDVLKAQVEVSKLIEQSTLFEQRKQIAEARINSLLYRTPEWPLGKPEEIKPQPLAPTLAELNELALAYYPTLKSQRRKIDREQLGVELAEKGKYPDFTVKLVYQNRPALPDMYGVSIGVSLPLWFAQKQRPAIAEAAASRAAEQKRLENLTTLMFFKLKDKYLSATTAQRLVDLYGTTIIPQSSLALESAIAGYEVGKVDFLTLLDSLVTLRNYELSYYEQLSNVEKSVAALEPLVGVPLRQ